MVEMKQLTTERMKSLLRPYKRKLMVKLEKRRDFKTFWDDPKKRYPTVAYVQTTNFCNAHCGCCLYDEMVDVGELEQGIMSFEAFKRVADKVKRRGIEINAMFCLGEPLLDPTILEKYEYGNRIGVFTKKHVGLNTNVSLLTEEKFDGILKHTPNIVLSFFNVGDEYERLTGGLSWERSYQNAKDFIEYRDDVKPEYPVFIGCNAIQGSDLGKVKEAFKGCNVRFMVDAELRWAGKVITGVIDRAIMYNNWICDGHRGAIQINWNGDCKFCAYDIVRKETLFANIFEHSWSEVERRFKQFWKQPSSLCARCDYYHLYWRVRRAGFKYINDQSWQAPFLEKGEKPIR